MKKYFLITPLIYFLNLLFLSISSQAEPVQGHVAFQGETFNFELSGQKHWDYDLKRVQDKNQTKVQLFVKSDDKNTIEQIKNIENPFIKSIQVVKPSLDGRILVEFTLKDRQIETFDYLTDQPSKLIVDFYQSEDLDDGTPASKELNKVPQQKNTKKTAAIDKSASKKSGGLVNRKPAGIDILKIDEPGGIETSIISKGGLFDSGDDQFSRFTMRDSDYNEEAVIRSQSNYYIRFPILESEFPFWNKMKENPPVYEFKASKDEENKQARLLKILFDKKRFVIFQQTAEWYKNKYPQSPYLELISYMQGDALIELWKLEKNDSIYEQAQAAYMQALEKYPDSALFERTSLLTGMLAIEKLDYMSAIRHLNKHINNVKFDNKISQQYAKIGLAYSFSKINKLDEALKILQQLESQSKDPLVLASAAVRRGDFYFNSKKYIDSINSYEEAIKKYSVVSQLFPSAFFNKMEAQFWLKKYKDSHQSGLDFSKNFPAHAYAPYALTRVGELLDVMGADQSKSVGAFLETHFRYGDSPKTIVARLHLLSTRMKSMKSEELDETLKKMDMLAENSELQNIDQFKTAMLADGFARRKEYRRAIEILSNFYQQNPQRTDSKQVTQRIVRNINDELKNLADKKEFKNLLKTYKDYADTWLKSQSRIDTDYLLALAYESAGAYQVALNKFDKTLEQLNKIKGTPSEKEILVNEYLPTVDSLQLNIALNNFENKNFHDAYKALEKIKNPILLTEEEQVSRILLASKLYEQKGDTESSIRYLSELCRLWKGSNELLLPALLRLAEIQMKRNNISDALDAYKKTFDTIMAAEKPDLKNVRQLSRSYSDLLIKQDKNEEAAQVLNGLISKFDPQLKLQEEKYQLGLIYFKKGEIKKASQSWESIPNSPNDIWKKLANEKLQQSNWDESFKKHIKRIPAMSQLEETK